MLIQIIKMHQSWRSTKADDVKRHVDTMTSQALPGILTEVRVNYTSPHKIILSAYVVAAKQRRLILIQPTFFGIEIRISGRDGGWKSEACRAIKKALSELDWNKSG